MMEIFKKTGSVAELHDTIAKLRQEREALFEIIGRLDERFSVVLELVNRKIPVNVADERRNLNQIRQSAVLQQVIETTLVSKPICIGLNIDSIHCED